MKYFHFDESIYKKLNENIFDDDIINDSDYNISNKLMDKEEVLKIFNILYDFLRNWRILRSCLKATVKYPAPTLFFLRAI